MYMHCYYIILHKYLLGLQLVKNYEFDALILNFFVTKFVHVQKYFGSCAKLFTGGKLQKNKLNSIFQSNSLITKNMP